MPGRTRRRGAPRRKIKALAGVKHHVGFTVGPAGAGDVVPRNERSRQVQGFDRGEAPRLICRTPGRRGRRGASRRKIKPLAGGEAPRWHHCRPVQPRRRGAPRRKITALIGVRHHVGAAECPTGASDVVPRDERSRL